MTRAQAYTAFNLADRIGAVAVSELIARCGDVVTAWNDFPLKKSRSGGTVEWEKEWETAEKFGVSIITPEDEAYPRQLLSIPSHPLALYVKGEVKALSQASVAIVGTRRATSYGVDQAGRISRELASFGWCIVSGLALGIDAAAHSAALDAKGVTVGVIGSGLDCFYPEANRNLARAIIANGGAVVSEFPFGREPDQETFPIRNHTVAGLARGVVAIEAPLKSGTLITTSIAANLGRVVMALPARVDAVRSAGCLQLIRDGAVLVRDARDIDSELRELMPNKNIRQSMQNALQTTQTREKPAAPAKDSAPAAARVTAAPPMTATPTISLEESIVLRNIDAEGVSLDKLVSLTGMPPGRLSSICMSLRIKGVLRYLPGNRVSTVVR